MRKGGCWTSNILSELASNPWAGTGGGLLSASSLAFSRREERVWGPTHSWLSQHFAGLALLDLVTTWTHGPDEIIHMEFLSMWSHSHHASLCNIQLLRGAIIAVCLWKVGRLISCVWFRQRYDSFIHSRCLLDGFQFSNLNSLSGRKGRSFITLIMKGDWDSIHPDITFMLPHFPARDLVLCRRTWLTHSAEHHFNQTVRLLPAQMKEYWTF